MDVRMPDGTVIQNVPEGTTKDQLVSKLKSNGVAIPTDWLTPQKTDPYANTAAGQSTAQNLLAGIGGGMMSLYLGGKQMLGMASPEEIADHKRAMAGLGTTKAGTVGDFLGQAAVTLPAAFIPGANTLAGASILGGVTGALQPVSPDQSRIQNVALGAAGGAAGKWVGDKALRVLQGSAAGAGSNAAATASASPGTASASTSVTGGATARGTGGGFNYGTVGSDVSAGLTDAQRMLMERGQAMGMQLTPGQASGSRALQQLEAKLESQPMTSGRFNAIKANNQTILNRVASSSIGEAADALDSHVLQQAQDRISNVYKLVADKTPRSIDQNQFLGRLAGVESDFEGLLPGSVLDNPLTKRLFSYAEKGQATGEQLQDLASKLGKAAHNQMTSANGDRQLGMALFRVKDMADDLLASGLSGKTLQAFDSARGQYRNLMLLTQRSGVINPSSGNINGNALASLLQQKDRNGFLFGRNQSDLYDAARFSQAFKPIVGDSGTATRMPLPSPTDFVLSLPFNVATRAYTSSPAINLAARAGSVSRNGLAPEVGGLLSPLLPQVTQTAGGLLGSRLSN